MHLFIRCLTVAVLLAANGHGQTDLTLTWDQVETAGISGFRADWDRPIVLADDGATRLNDHGQFGGGPVGDWSTAQPGAIVFDAVHRSVLVRFPGAAEAIAEKLRAGATIKTVTILLPFRDAEFFPLGYDMPAGMSFLGDLWVKQAPRWHAQAWALRRPWQADRERGPTYNAAVNGQVFWKKYGAQDEQADRYPTVFGPAEVSVSNTIGRLDVTAALTNPAFGKTLGQRLRQFEDCGVLIRKWELYDASYWAGGYEWGVATGQRGIRIGAPRLEVAFVPAAGRKGDPVGKLPPPATRGAQQAERSPRPHAIPNSPTAVTPTEADYAAWKEKFAFARPAWASDWQWQRLQELHALGGGKGFPETYTDYLEWLDAQLRLLPRAWRGFDAGEMSMQYAMYHAALPEPVKDSHRRYWWAWLMPDRPIESLVHGYIGGKEARAYYQQTRDWRGNFSVYRTYCHSMGPVNFNSWATTGAMFGGWIIGSDRVMAEARHGYDHFMTRTWTWLDGTSQESVDHYYFAHTLGPLKTIMDFAPGPQERLAARLNIEKHLDELIATWHPHLRRFISSSGRTGIAYPLYLQEGLNYILHTLSPRGALTDVGASAGDVAGREGGAFAREFAPGEVALRTQLAPWAAASASTLVDEKPLPYEATRSYVQWGSYTQTPLWKKSYLGHHYGLASIDISQNETVPVMAQWRRRDTVVKSWTDLGTLLARYGVNDTEFLDSIYHGTSHRNPNGIVGVQGGPTLTVQGRNSAIILASPVPDLKLGEHGRPVPAEIRSLQLSLALFNFEATPGWKLFVDGQPVASLPAKIKFGQRITIQDGVTYLGLLPLPATALGPRDTEVLLSAKGEPTEMQGGGKVKVTLTIDAYNYQAATPFDPGVNPAALDRAVAGFVVQLGDATEHANFAAFQQWFAGLPFEARWAEDEGVFHVAYGAGDDRIEAGFNPTAPLSQPTTQVFPYRRLGGQWPYLPTGIHRDTTTAIQSTTGRLEKNGATLTTAAGQMAYLQAFPQQGVYVAINPYRERVPFALTVPGNVSVTADGLIGQARVEIEPATGRVDVRCAAAPASSDPQHARALIVTGLNKPPTAFVDGQPAKVVAVADGYTISLVR